MASKVRMTLTPFLSNIEIWFRFFAKTLPKWDFRPHQPYRLLAEWQKRYKVVPPHINYRVLRVVALGIQLVRALARITNGSLNHHLQVRAAWHCPSHRTHGRKCEPCCPWKCVICRAYSPARQPLSNDLITSSMSVTITVPSYNTSWYWFY